MCVASCAFDKQSKSLQWMIAVSGGKDRQMDCKVLTPMYQWAWISGTMWTWFICWYLQLYHTECQWQSYYVERKCGCKVSAKTKHRAHRPVKYTLKKNRSAFLSIASPQVRVFLDCHQFSYPPQTTHTRVLEVLPICGSSERTRCYNMIRTYARCQGCAEGILILGEISQQMARASV